MKKLIVLLLTLSMTLSFVACGNSGTTDAPQNNPQNKNTESEVESAPANSESEKESEKTSEPDSSTEDASASLGNTSATTYESQFIGLGWKLPEGWAFASNEQMEQLNAVVLEQIKDKTNITIPDGATVFDMYALDVYGSNISIQLEKLSAVNTIFTTADTYCEAASSILKSTYESMGYTDISIEKSTVAIAGKNYPCLNASCNYMGVVVYQKMAVMKKGQYMCIMTASSAQTATIDAMFTSFYALQ